MFTPPISGSAGTASSATVGAKVLAAMHKKSLKFDLQEVQEQILNLYQKKVDKATSDLQFNQRAVKEWEKFKMFSERLDDALSLNNLGNSPFNKKILKVPPDSKLDFYAEVTEKAEAGTSMFVEVKQVARSHVVHATFTGAAGKKPFATDQSVTVGFKGQPSKQVQVEIKSGDTASGVVQKINDAIKKHNNEAEEAHDNSGKIEIKAISSDEAAKHSIVFKSYVTGKANKIEVTELQGFTLADAQEPQDAEVLFDSIKVLSSTNKLEYQGVEIRPSKVSGEAIKVDVAYGTGSFLKLQEEYNKFAIFVAKNIQTQNIQDDKGNMVKKPSSIAFLHSHKIELDRILSTLQNKMWALKRYGVSFKTLDITEELRKSNPYGDKEDLNSVKIQMIEINEEELGKNIEEASALMSPQFSSTVPGFTLISSHTFLDGLGVKSVDYEVDYSKVKTRSNLGKEVYDAKNANMNLNAGDFYLNGARISIVGSETLESFVQKINDAKKDTGVKATIVDTSNNKFKVKLEGRIDSIHDQKNVLRGLFDNSSPIITEAPSPFVATPFGLVKGGNMKINGVEVELKSGDSLGRIKQKFNTAINGTNLEGTLSFSISGGKLEIIQQKPVENLKIEDSDGIVPGFQEAVNNAASLFYDTQDVVKVKVNTQHGSVTSKPAYIRLADPANPEKGGVINIIDATTGGVPDIKLADFKVGYYEGENVNANITSTAGIGKAVSDYAKLFAEGGIRVKGFIKEDKATIKNK